MNWQQARAVTSRKHQTVPSPATSLYILHSERQRNRKRPPSRAFLSCLSVYTGVGFLVLALFVSCRWLLTPSLATPQMASLVKRVPQPTSTDFSYPEKLQQPEPPRQPSYVSAPSIVTAPLTLQDYTRCVARTLGVDEALALSVLLQESHPVNPLKVGRKGSQGPMQIKPATLEAVGLSRHERFLPMLVYGGVLYLKEMLTRFESLPEALAAYNMGPTRLVQRDYRPYVATQRYVRRILARIPKIRSGNLPSHPVLHYSLSHTDLRPAAPHLTQLQACFIGVAA